MSNAARTLFDFSDPATASRWRSVNDVVMGGQSTGGMAHEDGTGVFSGHVSLDGGGFASVRAPEEAYDLSAAEGLRLHVRGDGKQYQLSLYTQDAGSISYRAAFTAAEDWQSLTVPFEALMPRFRGRPAPDAPPFAPGAVTSMGFLIADQQEGPFRLEIAAICAA